jgi:hypothetical protein
MKNAKRITKCSTLKKWRYLYIQSSRFQKKSIFWKVPRIYPFVVVQAPYRLRSVLSVIGIILGGESWSTQRKTLFPCHFVHRKSHELTLDRIRAFGVRSRRVTLWTMEWPERNLSMLCWYVRLQTSVSISQRIKAVPTAKTNRSILF